MTKTVTIQGQAYSLPPLNAGQLRRNAGPLLTAIANMGKQGSRIEAVAALPDVIGQHADLLFIALKGQHTNLTLEDVESLSFPELQEAVKDLLEVSGLTGKPEGETKPQPASL